MRTYLVFRLYGPMASWGELAVGELRGSADHPSRSALLGLLGAALGVCRDDDVAQQALSQRYRFGTKLVSAGMPLRDFHTVQWPAASNKYAYRTRRQELTDKRRLHTILTTREFRTDSLCVVAVEATSQAQHDLSELAAALRQPVFVPYLGRKSCPLAVPLDPRIVTVHTLKEALDSRDGEALLPRVGAVPGGADARYFWDVAMAEPGMTATLQLMQHDEPLSRRRWQFQPRPEPVHLPGGLA